MKDNNEKKKNIRTRGIVRHLLENLLKKLPLILIESTWRDAIRLNSLSQKCTVNNKIKIIVCSRIL